MARAIRAGRARAKTSPPKAPQVDGTALRDLLADVAAEARLVDVPVNQAPWATTGLQVTAGEDVTWLAWGMVNLIKPLGIVATAHQALAGRVGAGSALRSPRDTLTFTADRSGPLELGSVFPAGGEPRPDGSVRTDRVPYRLQSGSLSAVVVRWLPGTDPREPLESVSAGDASGLCAAEAARLADPPQPPPGWEHHPLTGQEEIYSVSADGIAARCDRTGGIIQRPADTPLTPTLRLRWSWRMDELPSRLPEDTMLTHVPLPVRTLAPSRNPHRRARRHSRPRPLGRRGAAGPRRPSGGDRRVAAEPRRSCVADRRQLRPAWRGPRRVRAH